MKISKIALSHIEWFVKNHKSSPFGHYISNDYEINIHYVGSMKIFFSSDCSESPKINVTARTVVISKAFTDRYKLKEDFLFFIIVCAVYYIKSMENNPTKRYIASDKFAIKTCIYNSKDIGYIVEMFYKMLKDKPSDINAKRAVEMACTIKRYKK
jgi:hypothetical protein